MPRFLARSISVAKWKSRVNIQQHEVPADGVGADLRSANNALSFWLCDPAEERSLECVALVLASTRDQVQRLDLVWMSADEIARMNIGLDPTPGVTPVTSLNHEHRDLVGIDLSRLFLLAGSVAQAIERNQIRRFTERQVLAILSKAVQRDLVQMGKLKQSVADKIQRA